jgi:hypothetical protein
MFLLVLRPIFRATVGKKNWYIRHTGD